MKEHKTLYLILRSVYVAMVNSPLLLQMTVCEYSYFNITSGIQGKYCKNQKTRTLKNIAMIILKFKPCDLTIE